MKRALLWMLAIGIAVFAFSRTLRFKEALRGYAMAKSSALESVPAASFANDAERGAAQVTFGDLGLLTTDNLSVNAVPLKLLETLPDVVPGPFFDGATHGWQPNRARPLARFGMIYEPRLTGLPASVATLSRFADLPVGYVHGIARRKLPSITIEIAASGCAMCHVGRNWDAAGAPTDEARFGIPNHSIDFDGLIRAIVAAMSDPRATDDAILTAMQRRFPGMEAGELATYRKYVLPTFRKTIHAALARWGALHPWRFGGPGFSHGAAIVRDLLLGDEKTKLMSSDYAPAYVKIANIVDVTQKERILIDGSYGSSERSQADRFERYLAGFLPVLGVSFSHAVLEREHLHEVRVFLAQLEPPTFPGPIDHGRADEGKAIYAQRCAGCHGDRDASGAYHYPSRQIPVAVIGTDPNRATALPQAIIDRFNATAVGAVMKLEATDMYMPPPLRGVWAGAPYLHDGSVPTLWHLLTPEERPRAFWVGGHALDLERVGIAGVLDADGTWDYPAGYVPWSEPKKIDTREPGHSAAGHVAPAAGLSRDQKLALIEYLKTL